MSDPTRPRRPPAPSIPSIPSTPSTFSGRLRLPRIGDALRPWLIAIVWLMCAGLFKAALAQTTGASPDAPADSRETSLTLVIPFSAGSGPDHVARTMARVWAERSGDIVVVRNLPDRQGYLAARQVATARPDGQLLLLTCSTLLERPARLPDDPFQPPAASTEDFTSIARVGQLPFVTVFPPGMFGRWLTPLATPPAFATPAATPAAATPAATSAENTATLARVLPATQADRSALAAPPDWEDFDALRSRDAPAWNALLAPPHLPGKLADQLRASWGQVVSDPRVRMALAQTGTELWERIPAGGAR